MLSVCLVTGEWPPAIGGIGDYTALLAEQLRQAGVRVTVITTRRGQAAASSEVRTIPAWDLRSMREMAGQITADDPDVVHLQYQTAAFGMSPLANLLPALLRGRGVRKPFVTTFHDLRTPYLFPKAGPLRPLANRVLMNLSDACIFSDPSDLVAARSRSIATWIPIGPSIVPPPRVNRSAIRSRLGLGKREVVLVHFGFINQSKGLDVLLRAAERLVRAQMELRLLFVGEEVGVSDPTNAETARRLWELATALGVDDRILRLGPLPPREVSEALAATDLAVLPYRDGASLRRTSLLTCLAHALPVITTEPPALRTLAAGACVPPFEDPAAYRIDHRIAALVPPGDDAALARAIYRLASDPPHQKRLRAAGREFAERMSWPKIAEATIALYRRVL